MTSIHYLEPLVRSQNDLQIEIFLAQVTLSKTALLSEHQLKTLFKIVHIFFMLCCHNFTKKIHFEITLVVTWSHCGTWALIKCIYVLTTALLNSCKV